MVVLQHFKIGDDAAVTVSSSNCAQSPDMSFYVLVTTFNTLTFVQISKRKLSKD